MRNATLDHLQQCLAERTGEQVKIYHRSLLENGEAQYCLARINGEKKLIVLGTSPSPFEEEDAADRAEGTLVVCPLTPANANELRGLFPWTAPQPLGTETAVGCGDRLGLATPGHIRACRETGVRPVLAQQSIREMERTGRTPQDVMDDVTWAVFQEGYQAGFGADADHLKTAEDIDACFAVGYTMYTIDPSDHVDNDADDLNEAALEERFAALPWKALDTTLAACLDRYTGKAIALDAAGDAVRIRFDEPALKRAAVKYGAAIAHTKALAEHLAARYRGDRPDATYDLEMSVDETAQPTRPREHYFVAAELQRLGVEVTSLAPRFVGDFQKGIDFIGDRDAFEASFRQHAAIAEAFGDYKLSIHSGSDKFSIYPIMGRHAGGRLHLKTAGTSYLEALRVVARHAPELFRAIVDFAFERFEADRKTYHVTTDLDAIPAPADVSDADLEATYLDDDNGRQLLHITYGSVLTARQKGASRFRDQIVAVLNEHEEEHYETLHSHFLQHIEGVGAMSTQSKMENPSPAPSSGQ